MKVIFDISDVYFTDNKEIRVSIDSCTLSNENGSVQVERLILKDLAANDVNEDCGLYLPAVDIKDLQKFFRIESGGSSDIPFIERKEANEMIKKKNKVWYSKIGNLNECYEY